MEVQPRDIKVYIAPNGKIPFIEWLSSLKDISARAKIRIRLDRLSLGNFGDCKHVGGGVFELRIKFGPGYRVYFGQVGNEIILLLSGGDKNTQSDDIKKAIKYWADYKEVQK
ncbi:MAG: addiction module protein [Deltaproteobacteria bacterium RIFCSPHIGHO2_12_FULL_43_9]|nr:MAG: addiction module protein [Deltaproteobacteria bacterium RIFCSPHIGHO2_12_FULL_43_9]